MARKITPVPGVPPHLWHKHQPQDSDEEGQQVNMAIEQKSAKAHAGSSARQVTPVVQESKTKKVPLRQWMTTANDPGRMRRRMAAGYAEPLRAPPRMATTGYGGRLLYPHEASAAIGGSSPPDSETYGWHDQQSHVTAPNSGSAGAEIDNHSENLQSHKHVTTKEKHRASGEAAVPTAQTHNHINQFRPGNDLTATNAHRYYPTTEIKQLSAGSSSDCNSVAPPVPMHSPDIRDIRMPRPNANYCASVRSKMSLSLLKDNDNERLDDSLEPSPPKHSDIRNKLGLEPTMRMTAGKLINTDIWAGKVRTPGEAFIDPVFVNPWIEDYVENQTDYDVRANFLYEVDSVIHCHSDVDTYSGELLKPYQHDYTVPDYMNSESQDRQMTATASLFVKRNALNANPRKDRQGPARSRPGRYHAPMPLHIATPVVQAEREPSPPVTRARGDSDPYPFAPCIPCHVRPAAREDMEGVRTIYNFEVVNGIQALDTEPLSLSNWHGILDKTRDVKLPFVVVVGGTYHVLTSLSHDKKESSLDADLAGKILAFGFLTVRQPGLAGSFSGSSRMSAKAHVFVHPDYRRKKLGHVCLDKLMSTVSTRYSTKPGYEFVNCDDNPTYKFPRHHDRKFYAVFIDYFVPRSRELGAAKFLPDETELKWFEQVITSRYGFRKVGQLVAANRSRRTYEPSPVWLDTVMFEHLCQENMGFTYVL